MRLLNVSAIVEDEVHARGRLATQSIDDDKVQGQNQDREGLSLFCHE